MKVVSKPIDGYHKHEVLYGSDDECIRCMGVIANPSIVVRDALQWSDLQKGARPQ